MALAGVLLVTAFRVVERHAVAAILRSTRTDAGIFVFMASATVVFDLVTAVELGIAVAVLVAVVRLAGTASVVANEDPDVRRHWRTTRTRTRTRAPSRRRW